MSDHIPAITQLNRQTTAIVQNAMLEAMKGVEERYGIKILFKGGAIDASRQTATLKFEAAVVNETTGLAETQERLDFRRYAPLYGLKADDLDCFFSIKGTRYKIVGWRAAAHKFPVIAETMRGKQFVFTSTSVANAMHKG